MSNTFAYDDASEGSSWTGCCSADDTPPMRDVELHIDDSSHGDGRGRHRSKKHVHRPRSASNTRKAEIREEVARVLGPGVQHRHPLASAHRADDRVDGHVARRTPHHVR